MAAFIEYFSTVAGHVPTASVPPVPPAVTPTTTMVPGSLAVNVADQTIYALAPDGSIIPVSRYSSAGITPTASDLSLHTPVAMSNISQWGVGLSSTDLSARCVVDASGFSTNNYIPVFTLGILLFIPPVSCGVSANGAYQVTITLGATNTAVAEPVTTALTNATSGSLNLNSQQVQLVVYSDGQTYPFFYLPNALDSSTIDPSSISLFRISPYKTFGAIPVSTGPAAQPATAYWGTYP